MKGVTTPPSWAWLLAGIFLLQTAWTLVVPPYAGIDEFDHAYRAASVAEGYWVPGDAAVHGRGYLVPVPDHIIEAGYKACSSFDYTKYDNCNPTTSPDGDGNVVVASAAGNYNPFYYSLVGLPSLVLEGDAALYGMRMANVLLCCLVIGLCLGSVSRQSRSPWPSASVALTLTPVVMYASSTVAPNGLEIVSGLAMWTTGLVIAYGIKPAPLHWWMLGASMSLVATLHATGPLWCLMFAICFVASTRGRAAIRRAWAKDRRHVMGAATATLAVGIIDVGWILAQGTNLRGGDSADLGSVPMNDLLQENLLWIFQTIGAVPFRNQHIPVPAMAALLVLFLVVVVMGILRSTISERIILLFMVAAFFAVGTSATVTMYDKIGLAWQGRYVMPLTCGIPLLCGWLISQSRPSRLSGMLPAFLWALFVAVNAWSLTAVLDGQRAWEPPLDWTAPPTILLVAFGVTAAIPVTVAHRRLGERPLSVSFEGITNSEHHAHAGTVLAGSSIHSKEIS